MKKYVPSDPYVRLSREVFCEYTIEWILNIVFDVWKRRDRKWVKFIKVKGDGFLTFDGSKSVPYKL